MKGDGEGGRLVIIGFGMDTNYKPDIEFQLEQGLKI